MSIKQSSTLPKSPAAASASAAGFDVSTFGRLDVSQQCIFSVDVEDWFHILDVPATPKLEQWAGLPSHVEKDFRVLLDMFDEARVKTTCFFLGWVAERFPHLVKDAATRGHEIASHGYAHRLVYECSQEEFRNDVRLARDILQQQIGAEVLGYRSPGFSCTEDVPWFFDELIDAGYRYDSSVFPAPRGHGGMQIDDLGPHVITGTRGRLIEFPITVANILKKRICLFGGGYLRVFPSMLIHRAAKSVLRENRPVVFYIHPREINPSHPRLPMSRKRQFKSYVNLKTTQPKLRRIFREFPITTFADFIRRSPALCEIHS